MKHCKLIVFMLLLSCFSRNAMAQVPENSCIRDFAWRNADGSEQTVYKTLDKGKMILLVSGCRGTKATESLISSLTLQKINQEHGLKFQPDVQPFSTNDVQVILYNNQPSLAGGSLLTCVNFPITDNVADNDLPAAYTEPYLLLITPDRLIHSIPTGNENAVSLYKTVSRYKTQYAPSASPDVRLLRCVTQPVYNNHFSAKLYFQNFSTLPLRAVKVTLYADDQVIAVKTWTGNLGSLEDAGTEISGVIPGKAHIKLTVATAGESYTLNNTWEALNGKAYDIADAVSLPFSTSFDNQMPESWAATDGAMFSVVETGGQQKDIGHALRIGFNKKMPLQSDTLYMGHYNFGEHPFLNFNWAYAPSSEYAGANIKFIASADEGKTWEELKTFEGQKLATANVQSYPLLPQGKHTWKKEYVNLQAIAGKTNVWIAMVAVADFTNDGYLGNLYLFNDPATMAIR
ncbi:hypothetical protein ACTHGU_19340 [Chitinophagaceae bacterium MMS25-I14]